MCANNKQSIYHQSGVTQARRQLGVTLVELVVFMVIVSVALVGVLKVLDITNRGSADPLVRKQALSIAESLLLEIQQQPFTFCDPDDASISTATSAADCTNPQDKGGAALASPTPVSYTHLDVYKRQVSRLSRFGHRQFHQPPQISRLNYLKKKSKLST